MKSTVEKNNPQNKDKDIEKRKEEFTKKFNALKSEYELDLLPVLDFVEYKVLPEELQLALTVMNKHKLRYVFNLIDINDDKK